MKTPLPMFLALLVACAAPVAPLDPADPFAIEGADLALRPASDAEQAEIRARAADLHRTYGYAPDGTMRDLVGLRDLLDRRNLLDRLLSPPATDLAPALRALGYRFHPRDAEALVRAPGGAAGSLLADSTVAAFLGSLRGDGLLDEGAATEILGLGPRRAEELREFAALPDAADRVRGEAARLPYRFRPRDARALAGDLPPFPAGAPEFIRALLKGLGLEYRPAWRPELLELAARPEATKAFAALLAERSITIAGSDGLFALARLVRDHQVPRGEVAGRFDTLAKKLVWPDASDFPGVLALAEDPLGLAVVAELGRRFDYRLDAADAKDLLLLAAGPIPDPPCPDWIARDRVPLARPGLLRSARPAEAFAAPRDLRFMELAVGLRPDLVSLSLDALRRHIRDRVLPLPVRYRVGSPYTEDAGDLSGFLRPHLIKADLLLDALDDPETERRIGAWIAADRAASDTELGGYVRIAAGGRLSFELAPPSGGESRDDRLDLPEAPEDAVAEFHFHATDEDDADFAGPSAGGPGTDLFRAARRRIDGVVFTSLPGGRFDADYYTSLRFVLDLGIRPAEPD